MSIQISHSHRFFDITISYLSTHDKSTCESSDENYRNIESYFSVHDETKDYWEKRERQTTNRRNSAMITSKIKISLLRFTNNLSLFIARESFKYSIVSNVVAFRYRCLWIKKSRREQINQYHQQLLKYEVENYAKQSSKAMRQFQKKYIVKQAAHQTIFVSFSAFIKNSESL